MKGFGILLLIAGLLIAAGAFLIDTSVSTYSPYGGGEVSNLSLLHAQQLVFIGGCTLFLAGVALAAAGHVVATLRMRTAAPSIEQETWQTPAGPGERRLVVLICIAAALGVIVLVALLGPG